MESVPLCIQIVSFHLPKHFSSSEHPLVPACSYKWLLLYQERVYCTWLREDYSFLSVLQRFEKALARDNDVHNSGGGFLQVPLTNLKELYGIKFKHPHESEAFYRKILNELGKKQLVFVSHSYVYC